MRHVRGFVVCVTCVCVVCVVCVTCVCVFECQSVVNSNKRGHAAGATASFAKVAGSVSIFDVVSLRFRQSYHLLLRVMLD